MKGQIAITCLVLLTLPYFIISQKDKFLIMIHAGAIDDPIEKFPYERELAFVEGLKKSLKAGYDLLKENKVNLDAVQASLNSMEDNPTFNSGKGAKVTEAFDCELDTSIMNGTDLTCGACAGLHHIKNPINCARKIMEKTPHILLYGDSAEDFCASEGLELVPNKYFMTPIEIKEWYNIRHNASTKEPPQHETCGCIVLDTFGHLGAGTSTGGVTDKMKGRVGDSPIIGAGTYANDDSIAISCTGLGERMIKRTFSFDIRAKMIYANKTLEEAGEEAMKDLEDLTGGYISIDKDGNHFAPFNSPGMARAWVNESGLATIELWKEGQNRTPIYYNLTE